MPPGVLLHGLLPKGGLLHPAHLIFFFILFHFSFTHLFVISPAFSFPSLLFLRSGICYTPTDRVFMGCPKGFGKVL